MEALYCTDPVYFDPALADFGGFGDPFVPIWLVPITAAEAAFVRQRGAEAFEDILEAANPVLLDLRRPAVVEGGSPVQVLPRRSPVEGRVEAGSGRSNEGNGQLFRCRVCGIEGDASRFCMECLADTMEPASPMIER
jgi:hypothetical protein